MKVFIVDIAKCNGCYNCQIACKDEHVNNEWLPYAMPQPDTGHFWMKVDEKTHGSVPKVKIEYTPTPCMHCNNPQCIEAAENDAVYKREDGIVMIDPIKAKGQKQISSACPYNAVYWNETLQLPQKCTGCSHLVDEGRTPRCVEVCATDALRYGEEEEFKDLIAQAEVMSPELGAKPRVYYLNRMKSFVGGAVYDPTEDECLKGVEVMLMCKQTGAAQTTQTDHFGDFWFKKLPGGKYSLKLQKNGYQDVIIEEIDAVNSVNVGDIALVPCQP